MSIQALKSEVARQFGTPAVVIDFDIVERNIARGCCHVWMAPVWQCAY
jgi:D-serine deaminase-like pyridoxal phosphate-dependent protein